MKQNAQKLLIAIHQMYGAVGALRSAFPARRFTPDGKMVGDIGEAWATLNYQLILDEKSRKHWDAVWIDVTGKSRDVQIRATQGDSTYLKKPPGEGSLLLFHISDSGINEIYNGSITRVWDRVKHQRSKEKGMALKKFRHIEIKLDERIPAKSLIPIPHN